MIQKDNSISSKIILSCKLENNKTMLENSYFDIPYKIVHYGARHLQDPLEIMMMSYSPGVMDGDTLHIDVHCPARTEMKLFTQSFNKLHPMKKGASQYTKVRIEAGATFQYLPQPMIPFKDSIFQTTNEIFLEGNSHLIWGDIISGGRIHSGERFEFTRIHSKTKVYHDGKLIFFDNQLMEPSAQPIEELLFFEGATHQGTLLLVSPYAVAFKEELDAILTEQFTDMSYGFTQCGPNALMVRTLGESGESMHDWLANIGGMYWSYVKYKQQSEQKIETKATRKKNIDLPKTEPASDATAKKNAVRKKADQPKATSAPVAKNKKAVVSKSSQPAVKAVSKKSLVKNPPKAVSTVKKKSPAKGKTITKGAKGRTIAASKKR